MRVCTFKGSSRTISLPSVGVGVKTETNVSSGQLSAPGCANDAAALGSANWLDRDESKHCCSLLFGAAAATSPTHIFSRLCAFWCLFSIIRCQIPWCCLLFTGKQAAWLHSWTGEVRPTQSFPPAEDNYVCLQPRYNTKSSELTWVAWKVSWF